MITSQESLLLRNIKMPFTPVKEKIDKIVVFDQTQREKLDYLKTVVEAFIRNGHAAHLTIPGFAKTKPEIEAYMTLKGINIPIHGYLDHKGSYHCGGQMYPSQEEEGSKKMELEAGIRLGCLMNLL